VSSDPPFNGQRPPLGRANADNTYPEIWIQVPGAGQTITGPTEFNGWAIDRESDLTSVTFTVDGSPVGGLAYGDYRYDVCQAKNIFTCDPLCRVGWKGTFNPSGYAQGQHTLRVTATDSAGRTSVSQQVFYIGTSSCSHSVCTTGGPLVNGCSSCTSTVCGYDSYCCNVSWDSLCVSEAQRDCPGAC